VTTRIPPEQMHSVFFDQQGIITARLEGAFGA